MILSVTVPMTMADCASVFLSSGTIFVTLALTAWAGLTAYNAGKAILKTATD